ncbi:MAG TPA: hypothetical protein VGR55_00560 [Candidatus Acidoferrum sp.]|nr:hypothetical protein [Candidatus Acidoferrum sp.]
MTENVMIEVNETGVVGVHADISDTPFVNLISPAITHLDRTIQDLRAFTNSKAFSRVIADAAEKLGEITTEETETATAY